MYGIHTRLDPFAGYDQRAMMQLGAFLGVAPTPMSPSPGLDLFGLGGHTPASSFPQGFGAPAASFNGAPALTDYVRSMHQQLNQGGVRGAMDPAAQPQIRPEDAMLLIQLLMFLSSQLGRNGGGGGGSPSGRIGAGQASRAPSSPGRDLGSISNPSLGSDGPVTGGVSAAELRQVAPTLSESRAQELVPHLNRAMQDAGITTKRQQAAFIAQLSQESGEFKYFEEIASGSAYEGRSDLGNTQPGDGQRFKGRGPIQLTGRANYRAAGQALGLDLENNPHLVSTPEVGFKVAAWYWNSRNLNGPAEAGDFREVTRRINGGYNGYDVRLAYYERALGVLG